MKTDKAGCSTCPKGEEKYECFNYGSKSLYQYDYRADDGELFSCVCTTLDMCIAKRDEWLSKKYQTTIKE